MEWLFDNFQVFALIVIVIGSLMKRFLEAKAEERQARERMDQEGEGEVFDPEEWQMPEPPVPAVPPPLYRQGPPPLARQMAAEQAESEAVLKRQLEMQERLRQIRETKAITTGGAAATSSRVSAAQSHAKPIMPVKAGLRGALRDGKQVRRAIVLREILGPPVGLR